MPETPALSTKERLLASGALVFAERGFEGGSVREICRRAEASGNMVHHYFGSKAGLLDAIVERFGAEVLAVPMRLLKTPAKSRDDFASRIEMLFEATLDACMEHRALMMVVAREQAEPPVLAEYAARLIKFLEQGKRKGFVRKGLDAKMVSGAMLDRITAQVELGPWMKRSHGVDLSDRRYKKRWCAANVDLFLYGMLEPEDGAG